MRRMSRKIRVRYNAPMARFVLGRLAMFPVLLLAMYGGAVLLIMAAPGSGLESGDRELSEAVLNARKAQYNYLEWDAGRAAYGDHPWWKRYFCTWPRRLVWDQDLPAHQYPDWTVYEILRAALPISLQLGVLAFGLATTLGIAVGVASVAARGKWLDHLLLGGTLIGISLP